MFDIVPTPCLTSIYDDRNFSSLRWVFLSVANKHFMVDLPGKSWADLYREALLEVNPNRLPHLVEVAMDAVQSKLRAFPDGKISSTERQLLEDALKNLRVLQREYS